MDGFFHLYMFIGFFIGFITQLFHTHFNYFIVFSFKGAYIVSIVVFKAFMCGGVIIEGIGCVAVLDI